MNRFETGVSNRCLATLWRSDLREVLYDTENGMLIEDEESAERLAIGFCPIRPDPSQSDAERSPRRSGRQLEREFPGDFAHRFSLTGFRSPALAHRIHRAQSQAL
jgi:hypothetical protein